MTDNDRIDRLEKRVDKIEDNIALKLQHIFEKLEELRVDAASHACPKPGACIGLSDNLKHTMELLTAQTARVERLELKMIDIERAAMNESRKVERDFAKLERQKAWVLGAWSVIALAASVVGGIAVIVVNIYLKK